MLDELKDIIGRDFLKCKSKLMMRQITNERLRE
jgi:hypothetical protein